MNMGYFSLGVSLFALGLSLWNHFYFLKRIRQLTGDNIRLWHENIQLRLKLTEYEVEHEKVD